MGSKIFVDRDGRKVEKNCFYLDGSLNNLSSYHRYCRVIEVTDELVRVKYFSRGVNDTIHNPMITCRLTRLGRQDVREALSELQKLAAEFGKELEGE